MESTLTIRRVPLASLHNDPANARQHDERNIQAIRDSLARFGQVEPLVIQRSSQRVVGGNGRLTAMRAMGWTHADAVELDLNDVQAAALGIALNRTAELAAWEPEALHKLLDALAAEDSLDGVGFNDKELAELVQQLEDAKPSNEIDDPGPEAPPVNPVARRGDLWVLGDHRLLCGDSTSSEDVLRVMGLDRATLVATDPPYLVDYVGDRPNNSGKDWSDTYREIDIKDADHFFRSVFTNVLSVIGPGAALYCWHAHKRCGLIQGIWEELGILDHQQVIWIKPVPVFGRAYWHFRHEPCMMGWKQGSKPDHDGQHEFDSVWAIDYDGKQRVVGNEHPTQKPVEIFARPMRKHTKSGDVVFEPFSGSGSQLIAAELLRRRCHAIEITPAFVDVAIRRWEKATGKQATLDGQTYAEVKTSRGIAG